jgi:uncharacterized protein (TIGR02646 family)
MRPIEKWAVGNQGVQLEYNPYNSAKQKLSENHGDYCCYCDRQLDLIALEVEHVGPKSLPQYAALEHSWDNFLLACKNCNLAKGVKDLQGTILLPHTHNTFYAFSISPSAFVSPRMGLQPAETAMAALTIEELGLNRKEGDPKHTLADDRFKYRRQALFLAKRYLQKFESGKADVVTIVDLARGYGFWLVWMEVFANHLDVQQKLANAFQGTHPRWANRSLRSS